MNIDPITDRRFEALEHQLRVQRLVLLAVVETHPEPDALTNRIRERIELAMAHGLPSTRMPDKSLELLPGDLQQWLDSVGKAL